MAIFVLSMLAFWPYGLHTPLLSQSHWSVVFVTIAEVTFAVALAPTVHRIAAVERRAATPPRWASGRTGVIVSAVAGAIIAVLGLAAAMVVHRTFHVRAESIDAGYFMEAVIAAPLADEVYLRGLLQPAFANRLGPRAGLAIVTVISSLLHLGNALRVLPCMALLGLIRLRTKSVPNYVVAHAAYNLCLALITWL